MLTIVEGEAGTGRSTVLLEALRQARDNSECHHIYVWGNNFTKYLDQLGPKVSPFILTDALSDSYKQTPAVTTFLLDEPYQFMDCRTTIKRTNRLFTWFLSNLRHFDHNILISTYSLGIIDKRIRAYRPMKVVRCSFSWRTRKVYANCGHMWHDEWTPDYHVDEIQADRTLKETIGLEWANVPYADMVKEEDLCDTD